MITSDVSSSSRLSAASTSVSGAATTIIAVAERVGLGVDAVALLVAVLAVDRERLTERDVRRQRGIGGDVLPVGEHVAASTSPDASRCST